MLDKRISTSPLKNKCIIIAPKSFKTKMVRELTLPRIKTNFIAIINSIELAQEQTNRSMKREKRTRSRSKGI